VTRKGFLLAMMQPPPAREEEFNAWYDTEHIPERLAVPGFETARRYVAVEGWPRYLALYDMARSDIVATPEYLRVAGANNSPWTRRILASVEGAYRAAGVQLFPGEAVTQGASRALLLRFRGLPAAAEPELLAGLAASFAGRPETEQYRLLHATDAGVTDFLAFVELRAPAPTGSLALAAFGESARALDLVNSYAAYR